MLYYTVFSRHSPALADLFVRTNCDINAAAWMHAHRLALDPAGQTDAPAADGQLLVGIGSGPDLTIMEHVLIYDRGTVVHSYFKEYEERAEPGSLQDLARVTKKAVWAVLVGTPPPAHLSELRVFYFPLVLV